MSCCIAMPLSDHNVSESCPNNTYVSDEDAGHMLISVIKYTKFETRVLVKEEAS